MGHQSYNKENQHYRENIGNNDYKKSKRQNSKLPSIPEFRTDTKTAKFLLFLMATSTILPQIDARGVIPKTENPNQIPKPNIGTTTENPNQISEPNIGTTTERTVLNVNTNSNQIPKMPTVCENLVTSAINCQHFNTTIITEIGEIFCRFPENIEYILSKAITYLQTKFPNEYFIEFEENSTAGMIHSCSFDDNSNRKGKLLLTKNSISDITNQNIENLSKNVLHELIHHFMCLTSENSNSETKFIPANGDSNVLAQCLEYFTLYTDALSFLSDNISKIKNDKTSKYYPSVLKIANQWISSQANVIKIYEQAVLNQKKITLNLSLSTPDTRKLDFVRYIIKNEDTRIKSYQDSSAKCTELIANTIDRFSRMDIYDTNSIMNINMLIELYRNIQNSTTNSLTDLGGFVYQEANKYLKRFQDLVNVSNTNNNKTDAITIKV